MRRKLTVIGGYRLCPQTYLLAISIKPPSDCLPNSSSRRVFLLTTSLPLRSRAYSHSALGTAAPLLQLKRTRARNSTNVPPCGSLVGSLNSTLTRAVRRLFFNGPTELTETLWPASVSPTCRQSAAASATRLANTTGASTMPMRLSNPFFIDGKCASELKARALENAADTLIENSVSVNLRGTNCTDEGGWGRNQRRDVFISV